VCRSVLRWLLPLLLLRGLLIHRQAVQLAVERPPVKGRARAIEQKSILRVVLRTLNCKVSRSGGGGAGGVIARMVVK